MPRTRLALTLAAACTGTSGLAYAAPLPADLPPSLQTPAVQVAPAPGQVVLSTDQQARLHALLKKYALGCGNPNCPYCRGQAPAASY